MDVVEAGRCYLEPTSEGSNLLKQLCGRLHAEVHARHRTVEQGASAQLLVVAPELDEMVPEHAERAQPGESQLLRAFSEHIGAERRPPHAGVKRSDLGETIPLLVSGPLCPDLGRAGSAGLVQQVANAGRSPADALQECITSAADLRERQQCLSVC